ncbi:hypothetical protein PanWU01x14_052410 [Parasponia andersonii]|uniref:Uncharacterized protein n=1 Tax=Parasponia andersonii TaxID=3476 RepID=A0A2P5DM95_PARAD|nr:hypothetical protein PanWU01x14_052410 [Parasponia andersonii]
MKRKWILMTSIGKCRTIGLPKLSSHFRSPYQVRLLPAPSAVLQHC